MRTLKEALKDFSLSQKSRSDILNGEVAAPAEFEQIARIALAGHF